MLGMIETRYSEKLADCFYTHVFHPRYSEIVKVKKCLELINSLVGLFYSLGIVKYLAIGILVQGKE